MPTPTEEQFQTLYNLIQKLSKYQPIVYRQVNNYSLTSSTNVFTLEYKYTSLPHDGLLFFVPSYNCENDSTVELHIRFPSSDNGNTYPDEQTYIVETETNKGITRLATKGDIIANRMCIFRFNNFVTPKRAILINSPQYNEAIYSTITATNATFNSIPVISKDDTEDTLVTNSELSELENRIEQVEQRIIFGNEDPEVALADSPIGTIYIKTED